MPDNLSQRHRNADIRLCLTDRETRTVPDRSLNLQLLPGSMAVCRLELDRQVPEELMQAPFYSITRTADELSVVCPERLVPGDAKAEKGWRVLKVEGPLDLAMTGVLANLTKSLAQANVSVFALSTYDTDYLLIRAADVTAAVSALRTEGHGVVVDSGQWYTKMDRP